MQAGTVVVGDVAETNTSSTVQSQISKFFLNQIMTCAQSRSGLPNLIIYVWGLY